MGVERRFDELGVGTPGLHGAVGDVAVGEENDVIDVGVCDDVLDVFVDYGEADALAVVNIHSVSAVQSVGALGQDDVGLKVDVYAVLRENGDDLARVRE